MTGLTNLLQKIQDFTDELWEGKHNKKIFFGLVVLSVIFIFLFVREFPVLERGKMILGPYLKELHLSKNKLLEVTDLSKEMMDETIEYSRDFFDGFDRRFLLFWIPAVLFCFFLLRKSWPKKKK